MARDHQMRATVRPRVRAHPLAQSPRAVAHATPSSARKGWRVYGNEHVSRQREAERERQRGRGRERQRERETEGERDRETE